MQERVSDFEAVINNVGDCLIATLPSDIDEEKINAIKNNILQRISKNKMVGIVFDFHKVKVMDSFEFVMMINLCKMAQLLGSESVIAGLQPGVLTSILDMDVNMKGVRCFLNLQEGIDYFLSKTNWNESKEEPNEKLFDDDIEIEED